MSAEAGKESSRPQFGGRKLVNPEDVFQHNAWDNVVWSEEHEQRAQEAVAKNSAVTLTPDQIQELEDEAASNWDKFYSKHQNKFFKNRNWLFTEFPELALHLEENLASTKITACDADSSEINERISSSTEILAESSDVTKLLEVIGKSPMDNLTSFRNSEISKVSSTVNIISKPDDTSDMFIRSQASDEKLPNLPSSLPDNTSAVQENGYPGEKSSFRVLEVGCGVGNTIFPVLETNPQPELFVYGADFSATAIDIVKQHSDYDPKRCHAFVLDITDEEWKVPFPHSSLDVITCIYVLSAVHPNKHAHVARALFRYLKPGGALLLRDYGRYDLTQLRFKQGKCLADNYYVRGDGTKSYFFTQEEIRDLFAEAGFEEKQNIVDRRLQVNRGKQLTMYRVWVQAKYVKPFL
ncbi:tRNA N(3)-methylcytidine methyltransferase METTL2 isoform X2 [Hyalella azteca]|nr:tRNA N(3)-methylcytidine methyltransferase METTL2 isoform X2 [Hyalella azteca]XP_018026059.1 tRNA N(3)-methylcytidine methyltransferase METTL2 isoform X2 [Hyalella azteca]XP_047735473.1 tRNA N(3)-methylcytidine methyltransferase METTL2 isoform X2 [Hyalella azteca]